MARGLTPEQLDAEIQECHDFRPSVIAVKLPKWHAERAWEIAGQPDWQSFCRSRLGFKLRTKEERLEVEMSCTAAGMTNVDIAAGIGVTSETVGQDLAGHFRNLNGPAPEKRDVRGRPIPSKSALAERRKRAVELDKQGASVEEIARELGVNARSVRDDLTQMGRPRSGRAAPRMPLPPPMPPMETPEYQVSPIVKQSRRLAYDIKRDDWVVRLATLARSAAEAGDQAWLAELTENMDIIWNGYGRMLQVLRSPADRDRIADDPNERDSRRPPLGLAQ